MYPNPINTAKKIAGVNWHERINRRRKRQPPSIVSYGDKSTHFKL